MLMGSRLCPIGRKEETEPAAVAVHKNDSDCAAVEQPTTQGDQQPQGTTADLEKQHQQQEHGQQQPPPETCPGTVVVVSGDPPSTEEVAMQSSGITSTENDVIVQHREGGSLPTGGNYGCGPATSVVDPVPARENDRPLSAIERVRAELQQDLRTLFRQAEVAGYQLPWASWVPLDYSQLKGVVAYGEKVGFFKPGQTVMDMGCGTGTSSLVWASMGYNVIGIELNPALYGKANLHAQEWKEILTRCGGSFTVYQGSYYSKEYIRAREAKEAKAEQYETSFECNVFFPVSEPEVYVTHGIDIRAIDIFYCFAWKKQTPSLQEMFARESGPQSTMVLVNCNKPEPDLGVTLACPIWKYNDPHSYLVAYLKKATPAPKKEESESRV